MFRWMYGWFVGCMDTETDAWVDGLGGQIIASLGAWVRKCMTGRWVYLIHELMGV
jgi:hypothetical protein